MSRIIDADTVKQDIYKYIKEEGRLINPYRMLDYIDSVETSKKAIPIEWIEKWLDKVTGTKDGDDISGLDERLKFAIQFINLMEMDWEKENERD